MRIRSHLRSNVIGYVALFLALNGTAYAVVAIAPKNSVATKSIRNGAVTAAKLRNGAVTTDKIADRAVAKGKLADGAVSAAELGSAEVVSRTFPVAAGVENPPAGIQCPDGTRMLSGGAYGDVGVVLRGSWPELNGWVAIAKNNNATAATFTVIALCLTG
jgi:hypothetical protein